MKIEVNEEVISINGCRKDFKETFTHAIVHHAKIPVGEFKLEIPLNCRVESKEATLQRDEGLYKILCPKRKVIPTYLE